MFEITIAQRSPYAGRGPYHRFRATPVPLTNLQPAQRNMPATEASAVASVAIASSASATEMFQSEATASPDVPLISQLPPATIPFQTSSQSNDHLLSLNQQNGFIQRNADEKNSISTIPSITSLPLANSEVNKRNNFSVSRPVAVVVKTPAPSHRIPFKPRLSSHNRNFDDDFSEYDYGYDRQFDNNNHYSFYN